MSNKYYDILNLQENATIEEIETSYEKLSDQVIMSKIPKEQKNIQLEILRKAYSSLIDLKMEGDKVDMKNSFQWYVARSYIANEDKIIDSLWDRLRQYNMVDSVKEIVSFKETIIDEGEEIYHDSSELPKIAFKNSASSVWVRLKNGNFKKIRLKVRRPYKCFIFFHMLGDFDLFVKINSWLLGLTFLDFPNLKVITSEEVERMRSSVSPEVPNLMDYIKEKGYEIITGAVSNYVTGTTASYVSDEEDDEEGIHLIDKKDKFVAKIDDEEYGFSPADRARENIIIEKLRVNDFVYVSEMGTKGVVLEVNLKEKLVTVNINLFGRNQTIQCKPEQLKEF